MPCPRSATAWTRCRSTASSAQVIPARTTYRGLVLIPLASSRQSKIPVIASGSIADGRGMAAALTLGAKGVDMGTQFCAIWEVPIHESIKRRLVTATECDTRLIFRTPRNTARVLRNTVPGRSSSPWRVVPAADGSSTSSILWRGHTGVRLSRQAISMVVLSGQVCAPG